MPLYPGILTLLYTTLGLRAGCESRLVSLLGSSTAVGGMGVTLISVVGALVLRDCVTVLSCRLGSLVVATGWAITFIASIVSYSVSWFQSFATWPGKRGSYLAFENTWFWLPLRPKSDLDWISKLFWIFFLGFVWCLVVFSNMKLGTCDAILSYFYDSSLSLAYLTFTFMSCRCLMFLSTKPLEIDLTSSTECCCLTLKVIFSDVNVFSNFFITYF